MAAVATPRLLPLRSPKSAEGFEQAVDIPDGPPLSGCEAAGLEVAVRSWWGSVAGRGGQRRRAEDAWLRTTVAGGLGSGARAKLLRAGVPERVVEGGLELGNFIQQDRDSQLVWARCHHDKNSHSLFVLDAISLVRSRFDVVPAPWRPLEEGAAPQPSFIIAPRSQVSTSFPSVSRKGAAENSAVRQLGGQFARQVSAPDHTAATPRGHLADVPEQRLVDRVRTAPASSLAYVSSGRNSTGSSPHEETRLPSEGRQSAPALCSEDDLASTVRLPLPSPSQPSKEQFAATFPRASGLSLPAGGRRGSSRIDDVDDLSASPRRGSSRIDDAADSSPRRGSTSVRKKTTGNFDKWFADARRSSQKQQQHDEIAQEKKKNQHHQQVEGTPMLCKGSKKMLKKVVSDVAEVRRIFYLLDEERTGRIEPRGFIQLLAKLLQQNQSDMDRQEIWRNWELVDKDGKGWVTYEEFEPWYCETFDIPLVPDLRSFINEDLLPVDQREIRDVAKKLEMSQVEIEKIWKEFKKVDTDGSGQLEWDEFKALLNQQLAPGETTEVPPKVLMKFWMDVDADGSGSITFEEFATWYAKYLYSDFSPMESYYNMLGRGLRTSLLEMDQQKDSTPGDAFK